MAFNKWEFVKKAIFLIVLLFVLLVILTWTNIVKCSTIGPFWCNAYWEVMGTPKILIAYGQDGLGNANKLQDIFNDKDILRVRTITRDLRFITSGTLDEYDLVIVTQAKTMTAEQVEMFYDYAQAGGKLIWTGDAGTASSNTEKTPKQIYDEEYKNMSSDKTITAEEEASLRELATTMNINVNENNLSATNGTSSWVRITKEGNVIELNKLISADYIDNFCNVVNCMDRRSFVGHMMHNEDSFISYKLPQSSELNGDFAVVSLINNTSTKLDLMVDTRSTIVTKDINARNIERNLPLIIVSGLGEKIIYSAVPLEYYVDLNSVYGYDPINTGMYYPTIIEEIYQNMIRGKRP